MRHEPPRHRGTPPRTGASDVHGHMLERSVHEALSLAIGTLDDPRLDDLDLEGIELEGATLVATVRVDPPDIGPVTRGLERATPYLRRELAEEIHRKRVPNLRFVVLPRGHEDRGRA